MMIGVSPGGRKFLWRLLLIAAVAATAPELLFPDASPGRNPQDDWQVARAFQPDSQKSLSTESDRWEVSLTSWASCPSNVDAFECYLFRVQDLTTDKVTTFRLANQTVQVDAISIAVQDRLVILGRATPILPIVTIIDLRSGKEIDRIICEGPALSPNRRFITYQKFVPAHPGYDWSPSAEYLVYDLTASPKDNRTPPNRTRPLGPYDVGWPLYPKGVKNTPGDNMFQGHDVPAHWMISQFSWFDKSDRVAFVDRWQGTTSLIVADLSGGIQQPKVSVYLLNIAGVVDLPGCKERVAPSDFEGWSKDPATLIEVKEIQVPPESKGVLRLHLSPHPCLRTDVLDVRVDTHLSE